MSLASVPFLGALFAAVLIFSVLRGARARQSLFTALNVGFLASFRSNAPSLVALALFIGVTWTILVLARRWPSPRMVDLGVVTSVVFLVVAKKYFWLDWLLPRGNVLQVINVIGLSYMVFKFIHVLVDQVQGQLTSPSFPVYASYQLAFFTLTAGPVNRLQDFEGGWTATQPSLASSEESLALWRRVFTGILKLILAAPAFEWAIAHAQEQVPASLIAPGILKLAVNFYLFPLELYFNFSGYTDVAIASAQLLGYRLPENFDRPFRARNLIEFWDRWHMSLTHWLRDYIFITWYRKIVERARAHARPLGYLLLAGTFFLAGVWHGPEMKYAYFGLIHGVGLAMARAWGDLITERYGRKGFTAYMKHGGIRAASTVLTFHFVCGSLLIFALGLRGVEALWREFIRDAESALLALRGGHLDGAMVVPLCILPGVATLVLLYARTSPGRSTSEPRAAWLSAAAAASAATLVCVLRVVFAHPDPVIMYQKF